MTKLEKLQANSEEFALADAQYNYQKDLTNKLDNHKEDFSEHTLLEIALWKTNRYPTITKQLLEDINALRKTYSEEQAKMLLRQLLALKGFDLPMASTVLRFAVPHELQIIDQRVYRFITTGENFLKIPYNIDQKVALYFDYINRLKAVCAQHDIPFNKSDRILYQLDKIHNKDIKLKTSA